MLFAVSWVFFKQESQEIREASRVGGWPQSWTLSCTEGLFRCIWYTRQASEVLVSVSQTGVIESLDLEKRGDRLGNIGQEWQFENTLVLPLTCSATVLYYLGILIQLVNERAERHLKLLMSVTHILEELSVRDIETALSLRERNPLLPFSKCVALREEKGASFRCCLCCTISVFQNRFESLVLTF